VNLIVINVESLASIVPLAGSTENGKSSLLSFRI